METHRYTLGILLLSLFLHNPVNAEKSGEAFNSATDVHWEETWTLCHGASVVADPPTP